MKKALIFVFTTVLFLSITGIALASGYNEPTANPHGGYSSTSNKCKTCHAVHLAEGPFRLLRGATGAADECDYCHGDGGHASTIVKADTEEGHTMGWPAIAAGGTGDPSRPPDDSDVTAPAVQLAYSVDLNPFRCGACHSPHDNNTVTFTGAGSSKLLKKDPDGGESLYWDPDAVEPILTKSRWCSDCHSANYGAQDDEKTVGGQPRYGHDVVHDGGGALAPEPHNNNLTSFPYPCAQSDCHDGTTPLGDPNDGVNNGPTCEQCHQSDGFPHSQSDNSGGGTTSRDMLYEERQLTPMDSGTDDLDSVCQDCHHAPNLP